MASCRKEFRYTGRVKTCFGETKCCSQTGTAGTNNERIVLVILNFVSRLSVGANS